MRPGGGGSATNESKMGIPYNILCQRMVVRARTGPGAARVDTFTLRKNGVDTAMVATLTGVAIEAFSNEAQVQFLPGDDLSVKMITSPSTGLSDVFVSIMAL